MYSSTIHRTADSSRKMKLFTCVQNQTLLSNHRQSDQHDIHYQAVSKQYTKKQKTHSSKHIVLERYLWTAILFVDLPVTPYCTINKFREKYIFNLKTNFICFRHCLLMNKNMFYHSSSKLIWNYYSALLFAISFCSSSSLYTYFYSTVPCIPQTCPLSLWYSNSCFLLIWTCNQSKSIEQSVLLTNGKHNVQAIQFVHCTVYSLQCTVLQYTILKWKE